MSLALLSCNLRMDIRPGNTSFVMVEALVEQGLLPNAEVWRFIHPTVPYSRPPVQLPTRAFQLEADMRSTELSAYVAEHGQPDILWVDERYAEPHVLQALDLCPDSFKIVYGADRADKVERLDRYDFCFLDEPNQVKKVRRRAPSVQAYVWDKFVDEDVFHPVPAEKRYDICYVAMMTKRKKHELLLRAMARFKGRDLTCVCLGGPNRGGVPDPERVEYLQSLKRLAEELGVSAHFPGRVSRVEVNRYLNQSRIGVMCSRKDGAPRAVLEYMAADLPVLVSSELLAGQRYVAPEVGLIRSPEEFHTGIAELLDNRDRYHPRDYFLRHFTRDHVVERTARILREAGCPIG